jgi:hypothetical protein
VNLLDQFNAWNDQHNGWPLFVLLLAGVTAGAVIFVRKQ